MATNFPASLDTLTNPTPTTSMSGSLSHAGQHSDLNDAVEALQAKVGADGSAVTTSHDYLIADHASRITTLEGAPAAGLTLIKKVTFSGVTSFSEDNVFTSAYDNYLILISGVSSSNSDNLLRLRSSGTDDSAYNYYQQFVNVTGATVSPSSQNQPSFYISSDSTDRYSSRTELFNPAVAVETGMMTQSHRGNLRLAIHGAYHNQATAYDGFTILDNGGTITGTLWLYGFAKA